jgi:hypothetical protein
VAVHLAALDSLIHPPLSAIPRESLATRKRRQCSSHWNLITFPDISCRLRFLVSRQLSSAWQSVSASLFHEKKIPSITPRALYMPGELSVFACCSLSSNLTKSILLSTCRSIKAGSFMEVYLLLLFHNLRCRTLVLDVLLASSCLDINRTTKEDARARSRKEAAVFAPHYASSRRKACVCGESGSASDLLHLVSSLLSLVSPHQFLLRESVHVQDRIAFNQ